MVNVFAIAASLILFVGLPFAGATGVGGIALAVAAVFCVLCMVFSLKGREAITERAIRGYEIALVLLLVSMVLRFFLAPAYGGVVRLFEMTCCACALFFGRDLQKHRSALMITAVILIFSLIACYMQWVAFGCPLSDFSAFWENPNSFGFVLLCWFTFFAMAPLRREVRIILCGACFVMVITSSARSVLASIAILVLIYLLQRRHQGFGASCAKVTSASVVFLAAILAFVVTYTQLFDTPLGDELNQFSIDVFGKNFYSGRQVIWGQVISAWSDSFLIGHGLHAMPSDFYQTTLSAHNLYLEVALQSGVFGLLAFVGFLSALLFAVAKSLPHPGKTIVVAFFFAVALHQAFEVTLTQNAFMYGMMAWSLFGMGLETPPLTCKQREEKPPQERFDYESAATYRKPALSVYPLEPASVRQSDDCISAPSRL